MRQSLRSCTPSPLLHCLSEQITGLDRFSERRERLHLLLRGVAEFHCGEGDERFSHKGERLRKYVLDEHGGQ